MPYPNRMPAKDDQRLRRVTSAVISAATEGADPEEIRRVVEDALTDAEKINAAIAPIDFSRLPTIGSLAA